MFCFPLKATPGVVVVVEERVETLPSQQHRHPDDARLGEISGEQGPRNLAQRPLANGHVAGSPTCSIGPNEFCLR